MQGGSGGLLKTFTPLTEILIHELIDRDVNHCVTSSYTQLSLGMGGSFEPNDFWSNTGMLRQITLECKFPSSPVEEDGLHQKIFPDHRSPLVCGYHCVFVCGGASNNTNPFLGGQRSTMGSQRSGRRFLFFAEESLLKTSEESSIPPTWQSSTFYLHL